jgi:hypothetical protein
MPPTLFSLVISDIGIHFLPQSFRTSILPLYTSCLRWDDKHITLFPAFSVDMGVSQTFLPRLSLICNPPDLSIPHNWDNTLASPRPVTDWDGGLNELCPRLAPDRDIPISASQVAEIFFQYWVLNSGTHSRGRHSTT